MYKLEDIKEGTGIETIVVSADISNAQKIIAPQDSDIVGSIMDSCGLPYFFRTWNTGGSRIQVDGGICENLPIDELKRYEKEDGPVVAISFRRDMQDPPRNFQKFTLSLLETAINNSTNRAKSELPDNQIFYISTSIGTFDFKKALTDGLGTEYELIKAQARSFFSEFKQKQISEQYVKEKNPWAETNPTTVDIMKKMGEVYKIHHGSSQFKHIKCSLAVQANCLLDQHEIGFGEPDWLIYSVKFQPWKDPVYCMSIALGDAEGYQYLNVTSWEVFNLEEERQIRTIDMPVTNTECPEDRSLTIFFDPALPPNSGTYELTFKDRIQDLMIELRDEGTDKLAYQARRAAGLIGSVDLVLHVPERYQDISLIRQEGDGKGREMRSAELAKYRSKLPVTGFRSLGWTAEDVDASNSFEVGVTINRRKTEDSST